MAAKETSEAHCPQPRAVCRGEVPRAGSWLRAPPKGRWSEGEEKRKGKGKVAGAGLGATLERSRPFPTIFTIYYFPSFIYYLLFTIFFCIYLLFTIYYFSSFISIHYLLFHMVFLT